MPRMFMFALANGIVAAGEDVCAFLAFATFKQDARVRLPKRLRAQERRPTFT
jgi:hypothetical protein